MIDKKFQIWVYLETPNKHSGKIGWVNAGQAIDRETAESIVRFAQYHNPNTRYEIREVEVTCNG